jgi:EAL domain-containing protein (putative c-di-GMP-specific phosphodiesterase class I)
VPRYRDEVQITIVVELARSLGLGVVAEGVETGGQRQALSELHCGSAQGYLFARPQPAQHCRPDADLSGVPAAV